MFNMKILVIPLFWGLVTGYKGNSSDSSAPRLLLVSFDGFRADYLKSYDLPHLQNFIKEGVLVEHVKNVFITKTFPNHYSIVTGYDNSLPSMHPFLAAHGPAFRKGYRQSTINTVDIYPMMCHILGLKPHPNNGTLSHTKCLLVDQWCINLPEAIGIVVSALLVLTMLTGLMIFMRSRASTSRPFSRLQLQEDDDDPLID